MFEKLYEKLVAILSPWKYCTSTFMKDTQKGCSGVIIITFYLILDTCSETKTAPKPTHQEPDKDVQNKQVIEQRAGEYYAASKKICRLIDSVTRSSCQVAGLFGFLSFHALLFQLRSLAPCLVARFKISKKICGTCMEN